MLTEREHHILHLIGEGLSSPQIAERLNYSVSTISENTMAMYRKLGLTDRSDAITLVHPSHLP